jgi:uncharacterized membrane protein YhaH (DUF805 family)
MSLMPAALGKYATFSGRARRSEYWVFIFFYLFVYVAFLIAGALTKSSSATLGAALSLTGAVFSLAMIIPSIAVSVRRLHDTDRSGWWFLLALVPLIGSLVLMVFFLLDSQPGDNRFGPNPKGVPAGAAAGGMGTAVVVAVVGLGVVFIGGIVAAVAIPAYQDYQARVAIDQALRELSRFGPQLAQLATQRGNTGSLAQAGIALSGSQHFVNLYYDPNSLTLVGNLAGSFRGRSLGIQYQSSGGGRPMLVCGSKNLEMKHLPPACRRQIAYLDEREALALQRAAPSAPPSMAPAPVAREARAVPTASPRANRVDTPPPAVAAQSAPRAAEAVTAIAPKPDSRAQSRTNDVIAAQRRAAAASEQDAQRRARSAQSACVYKPVMTDEDIAKCR